jgi:hypothetical protein
LGRLGRAVGVCFAVAVAGACTPDEPCDPDQIYQRGLCVDAVTDAGPPADAGPRPDAGPHRGFGDPCTDPEDPVECIYAADVCVPLPGQDPFCSALGCLDDPAICPPGWMCVDVSMFDPRAVGGVCLPP